MVLTKTAILVLATLLTLFGAASAYNQMFLDNKCSYPVYAWGVDQTGPVPGMVHNLVPPYSKTALPMLSNPGMALKMRDLSNFDAPGGIIQAEYTLTERTVFYDMSLVDCDKNNGDPTQVHYCPFAKGGIKMYAIDAGTGEKCPVSHCQLFTEGGECVKTYLLSGDRGTLSCPIGADLYLEFCTDGDGERSADPRFHSHA